MSKMSLSKVQKIDDNINRIEDNVRRDSFSVTILR